MAAVLACGAGARLSHGTAARVWGLDDGGPDPRIHVGVVRGHPSPGPDVCVHRLRDDDPESVVRHEGLPLTTPARTLLDLAGYLAASQLERAVARARRQELVIDDDVARLLARHPRRRGVGRLRAIMALDGGPAFTRSEAEARLLELVRRGGLAAPRVNARVAGWEVDFVWTRARLIVEVDGYAFHASTRAFERDRERDATLMGAGYRVARVTWRQLTTTPEAVLVRLAQALAPAVTTAGSP